MPEVIFNGPEGRLEGRYQMSKKRGAPIALLLHPHPQFGGTMNNQIIYNLYYQFLDRGFSVLRFKFPRRRPQPGPVRPWRGRAVRRGLRARLGAGHGSRGQDLLGRRVSFGAWIGMQLLMRRPEIEGFLSIAAMANRYDYTFLAPCPSSGLFVHGENDRVSPAKESMSAIDKVKTQKGIKIEHAIIPGANHFFEDRLEELKTTVGDYLDKRLEGRL